LSELISPGTIKTLKCFIWHTWATMECALVKKKLKIYEKAYLPSSRDLKSQKWLFDLFFDWDRLLQKKFSHYIPCSQSSLSSRKSWNIYAFSMEKNDFYFRIYTNFKGQLWPKRCVLVVKELVTFKLGTKYLKS
jgi:hypothetical protein